MKLYFDDVAFHGQLQRSVGKADAGMANVGECLAIATATQITPGDRDSWYDAWSEFGGRLVARGEEPRQAGHHVSAHKVCLRAAEYFRQPFFFHREDLDADKLRRTYSASLAAFQSALKLSEHSSRVLTGALSGYLLSPAGAGRHPTILHIDGYDGHRRGVVRLGTGGACSWLRLCRGRWSRSGRDAIRPAGAHASGLG